MTTAIEIDELFNRIYLIALLEDNWNDNGASKFSKQLIDRVKNIVNSLDIKPEIISPTARDSIQLEYNFNYNYLEFEIFENGDIKIFYYDLNTSEQYTIINKYLDKYLNDVVNKVYDNINNNKDIILHEVDYNVN